jgi:hypothetical protein
MTGSTNTNHFKGCLRKIWTIAPLPWMRARALIEKGEQTCPRSDTVLLSLLSLIVFLMFAVSALVIPTTMVKHFIFALNGTVASVLGATLAIDLMTSMYHDPSTQESES